MARRTKDVTEKEEKIELNKKLSKEVEKPAKKSSSSAKKSSSKASTTSKATKSASAKTTKKTAEGKKTTTTKKTATKKKTTTTKKTAAKKTTTKKATTKKKKATTTTTTTTKKRKQTYSPEYYELPYRYNQTIVKILAQTPNTLFVYWDISDEDRKNLKSIYGEHFFEITKPVLIIYNDTMGYSFEIDINDFANSWYIKTNDANCAYRIELGRRPIPINYNYIQNYNPDEEIKPVQTSYIYLTSSNEIKAPNDKILFNINKNVYYRNVKTNEVVSKDISNILLLSNIGRFYNIFDLYKHFYNEEELLTKEFDLRSSSSSGGNPSSGSLSSKFK